MSRLERIRAFTEEILTRDDKDQLGHGSDPRGGGRVNRAGKTPKSFWSYQAASETPSLEEAIKAGAVHPSTTQGQWEAMSPGMRREVVRGKGGNR